MKLSISHGIFRCYCICTIYALLHALGNIAVSEAAVFCVSTSKELQIALREAASNGENDVIQVVQGICKTPGYMFEYFTQENFDLMVLGGYNTTCSGRLLDPSNTVLDGQNSNKVIRMLPANYTSGNLYFQGFTVQNGWDPFINAVDIYFGLSAPAIGPDLFILKPDNTFQPVSEGLIPWRENVKEDVQGTLFGEIPSSLLPTGTYTLYLLISPTGTVATYYLWSTTFLLP